MAVVIPVRDPTIGSLGDCAEALSSWGFDPEDEVSVSHAANWLKRLSNDRTFLGDMLLGTLADGGDAFASPMGAHSITLLPPGAGGICILARIWPSERNHVYRASTASAFGYGTAHDHNFDFLTTGYFGPGTIVDDFEYDYEEVVGWSGEPVALRALGRSRLEPGRLVHYRAHRDIHRENPPAALSVTLSILQLQPAQSWMDHYEFDTDAGCIARVDGHGPSESLLRIAVALGSEEAVDLAVRFGRHHPSDRMRLEAWHALACAAPDEAARDALWREAEGSGSRLVAQVARGQRSGQD